MKNRLRELRINTNKSQEDVAKAVGSTARSLIRYEACQTDPSLEMAMRLAAYYQKSVDYVFKYEPYKGGDHQ